MSGSGQGPGPGSASGSGSGPFQAFGSGADGGGAGGGGFGAGAGGGFGGFAGLGTGLGAGIGAEMGAGLAGMGTGYAPFGTFTPSQPGQPPPPPPTGQQQPQHQQQPGPGTAQPQAPFQGPSNGLAGLGELSEADTSALLDLARLSPEQMASVLSAAGISPSGGGMDIAALLGIDMSAFDAGAAGEGSGSGSAGGGGSANANANGGNVGANVNANPSSTGSSNPNPATTAMAASTSSATGASTSASTSAPGSARPDLVRLADLVTHASLVLSQPQAGPRKYTRSRRGCLTCRARKVKCDEVRPNCLRCTAMGRDCTWDEEKGGGDKAKKPRKKTSTSSSTSASTSAAAGPIAPAPGSSTAVPTPASTATATSPRSRQTPGIPLPVPTSTFQSRTSPTSTSTANASSLPNLSFLQPQVPPLPSGAASQPAPASAEALAAAGLPPSLAKALSELAPNGQSTASPTTSAFNVPGGASWATHDPGGHRRQSDPTPSHTPRGYHQPFKPTPPSSGPHEPHTKRKRTNDGGSAPSELAGLPFDFQSWVANVDLGSPTGSTSVPKRKGSDGDDVIELSRSTPDAQGRIRLEPATSEATPIVVDEEYAQAGDIQLSLKGKLARRRGTGGDDGPMNSNANATGASASATSSTASASAQGNTSPSTPLQPNVSQLIKLATQPGRELDPFMHAFPTAATRGLFQHYVDSTAGIVTAMGRSKPCENPFLQVSLPLVLGDTQSPGCAALRFSLLTTSAAHIFHLRGEAESSELCERMKQMAIGYTVISQSEIEKERRVAAAAAAADGDKDKGNDRALVVSAKAERDNDLVLAACVVLVTRDVLSADPTWKANLEFAIASIRRRGGPEALMAADPTSFMRRFVLEQLATHEVFSCFTTGGEPTLLLPHAKWWFDVERSSRSNWEWESVENQFGISRTMVEVVGRICALCARKNRLGPNASLDDPELAPVAEHLRDEAETLLSELDHFAVTLRSLPLQRRVQYGDHIYRMTMSLHLMTEILCLSNDHPRIRAIVPAALELCSEISSQPVMLVWPLLILARVATAEEREWVRGLVGSYSDQYCRDLQVAQELIVELWKRQDEGRPPKTWHGFMADMGKTVLLI